MMLHWVEYNLKHPIQLAQQQELFSEIEAYSNSQAASAPNSELRFKTSTNTESTATTKNGYFRCW